VGRRSRFSAAFSGGPIEAFVSVAAPEGSGAYFPLLLAAAPLKRDAEARLAWGEIRIFRCF